MSNHHKHEPGDDKLGKDHFDEVEAMRRFPSEDVWLDLPMPDLTDTSRSKGESFADRVLRARREEQQLNAHLSEFSAHLPSGMLQQFAPPEPSSTFVDDTVQKVSRGRHQHWQKMMARYVAIEPSETFVARTLAALRSDTPQADVRIPRYTADQNWTVFGLVAAAAAAIVWLFVTNEVRDPLELRLASQAPPSVAYADATTPMAAIFARIAHEDEPFAVFDEPAAGLWLTDTSGELR